MDSPRIAEIESKRMTGLHAEISMSANRTRELWSLFMPRLRDIENRIGNDLYSIQVYKNISDLRDFDQNTRFTTWAAVEVSESSKTPDGMENFILPGGLYAVFLHYGPSHTFPETAKYIFRKWLPASDYELDHRPHFAVMDENYKGPDNPESVEEIWIPVKVSL